MRNDLPIDEIVARYKNRANTGENTVRLAAIYGCSITAIHNRLKKAGVKMTRLKTVMTPAMEERVAELIKQGMSARAISKTVGVNPCTIRAVFQFDTIIRRHRAALRSLQKSLEDFVEQPGKSPEVKEKVQAQIDALRYVML